MFDGHVILTRHYYIMHLLTQLSCHKYQWNEGRALIRSVMNLFDLYMYVMNAG